MASNWQTEAGIDKKLAQAGHHPLPTFWAEQHARFYAHHTARALVARVGRGGVKSQSSAKLALNEVLFGEWQVPPGERHYFAFVSATKDEAAQRLTLLRRFLIDLGVPHEANGDELALKEKPLGFRVFAAQVGAVSGFRCIGFVCDELAKWKAADRFTNPASEVVASLNGMIVTHAQKARRLFVSSPLAMVDYHYELMKLGDTEEQLVCQAPTWVANPSISEEETRKLETDRRVWAREYAAIPQAAALAAFDPDAIDRAFVRPAVISQAHRIAVIDASSGKKDTWSWGVCGWAECDGSTRLAFEKVDGFEGSFWEQMSGDQIVAAVADALRAAKIRDVVADQRESLMLRAAFGRYGITFHEIPWTNTSKERAVSSVRRWLADGMLVLPEHEKLRAELMSFEERVTASGAFTFGARGTGHDDYVSLLLTAAMADQAELLPNSPSQELNLVDALQTAAKRGYTFGNFFR